MCLCEILIGIVSLVVLLALYCQLTYGVCKSGKHLVGKVVIVTGANAGIGYETARILAERGARVILACRNEARGTKARDEIIADTGNENVHFRQMDLASFASVREFANDVLKTEKRLDILINNAGVMTTEYEKTEDGLLLGMQINHFGPFLLTNLLLPLLKATAPSRIINVSSGLYKLGTIDFDNLHMEKKGSFNTSKMYRDSKLCNVLMTAELDRLLRGTGVTANSLHPGGVATDLMITGNKWIRFIRPILMLFAKDLWKGAQTTVHLAVAPEVSELSGRFFSDCSEETIYKKGRDPKVARKLWQISEQAVGLSSN